MSVKDGLHAKLAQLVDESGKTPPRPGVRNSSKGLVMAWRSQGYATTFAAKPLRP